MNKQPEMYGVDGHYLNGCLVKVYKMVGAHTGKVWYDVIVDGVIINSGAEVELDHKPEVGEILDMMARHFHRGENAPPTTSPEPSPRL